MDWKTKEKRRIDFRLKRFLLGKQIQYQIQHFFLGIVDRNVWNIAVKKDRIALLKIENLIAEVVVNLAIDNIQVFKSSGSNRRAIGTGQQFYQ